MNNLTRLFLLSFFIFSGVLRAQTNNIKFDTLQGCLCYYVNVQDSIFYNVGLYDFSLIEYLDNPARIYEDSIVYFKSSKNQVITSRNKIMSFMLYDVADITAVSIDSIGLDFDYQVEYAYSDATKKYQFSPLYYNSNFFTKRFPNKVPKGVYVNCKKINAVWLIRKYSSFQSKVKHSGYMNYNPIDTHDKKIKSYYFAKDTLYLAYPVIINKFQNINK